MADATAQGFPVRIPRDGKENDLVELNELLSNSQPTPTRRFGRGQLYHVLSNPIYVGKVRHREKVYEGEHEAIIDRDTFARVQALLAEQAPRRQSATNNADLQLLTGILFDEDGNRLFSVHTRKGDVRYRYYISKLPQGGQGTPKRSGWRLPARTVEEIVETELMRLINDGRRLSEALRPVVTPNEIPNALAEAASFQADYQMVAPRQRRDLLASLIRRIELGDAMLTLRIDLVHLAEQLLGQQVPPDSIDEAHRTLTIASRFSLRRRGVEAKLVLADPGSQQRAPDQGLVALIAKAHDYLRQLTDGSARGISEVAAANNVDRSDFTRILRLAFLAPDLVDRMLNGSQPIELTAQKLSRLAELPHSWVDQRAILGE